MKQLLAIAVPSLGITTLCNLWMIAPLVAPGHMAVYHWSGTSSSLFAPAILDFALFWLASAMLLLAARTSPRIHNAVWLAFILYLPCIALKTWQSLCDGKGLHHIAFALFVLGSICCLVLMLRWQPHWQSTLDRAVRLFAHPLAAVAALGFLVLCQLGVFAWQARALNQPMPLHATVRPTLQPPNGRVIWLLFDELSYQQVYGQRAAGLALPEFDRLATQSTVFTHVIPAGIFTDNVLPSLMTGQPVDQIHASADGGHLSLHDPTTRTWNAFDPHNTIFEDALDAHRTTAVAGWHHPYCRILPQVLDQCYWTAANNQAPFVNPYLTRLGLLQKLLPAHSMLRRAADPSGPFHVLDYQNIFAAADRMLSDSSDTFLFIHMPIPHPGGIYSRATGSLVTTGSSYLDNLALADRYLAHIRALLEQSGQWDSTTLIVMGDHSWRTQLLWSSSPAWTHEEQLASHGGQFDDRPAYLVKLPNQHSASRINAPYTAIHTRALLNELIAAHLTTPQQLAAFAQSSTQMR